MRIEVTSTDIAEGRPLSPTMCPIARAIRRKVGHAHLIQVGDRRITVGSLNYSPSSLVKHFIDLFDDGHKVQPFEFELI